MTDDIKAAEKRGYSKGYAAGKRRRAAIAREDRQYAERIPGRCYCDERGIGEPGVTCGDCPRDYGHRVATQAWAAEHFGETA